MKDNYTHIVNFDYASRCEIKRNIYDILEEYTSKPYSLDYEYTFEIYEETKKILSQLLKATPSEIALIPDTSLSINIIAQALPVSIKNEIILPNTEPPENVYPWFELENKGFHTRIIEAPSELNLDKLLKKLGENILLMPISHVDPVSGSKRHIEIINKYLKEFDIMMLVNASYSLGVLNIQPKKIGLEFLASNGDRWLCGLPGSGIAYINKEIVDKLKSPLPSIYGDEDPYNHIFRRYKAKKKASKFEATEPNPLSYLLLSRSLREILSIGIDKIESKILTLGGWLIDELEKMKLKVITPYDRGKRGGIISFYIGENGDVLRKFLMKKGLKVSIIRDIMRISLHYKHNEEDIYMLLEGLEEGIRRLNLFPSHSL